MRNDRSVVQLNETAAALKNQAATVAEEAGLDQPRSDIEDFIYLISHDVRSSVRALLELPQWIAEDLEEAGVKVDGPVATSIGLMNKHTGRLDRMLVDLLAYSRVGRMQEVKQMDLQTCVDQVLDEHPLPTNFGLMTDLAHPALKIGERDILTLFAALISNAVKHHDKSVGRILVASEQCDGRSLLHVSDDGPGIDPAFHARVVQAMTTLRPRDEVEGSGMGLAVVAKIAELNGGSLRIGVSPFGRGTCVTVDLPLKD